jgi:hypothetical protein
MFTNTADIGIYGFTISYRTRTRLKVSRLQGLSSNYSVFRLLRSKKPHKSLEFG